DCVVYLNESSIRTMSREKGFASRKEKIVEKLKLFLNASTLIYCSDHPDISKEVNDFLPGITTVTWGHNQSDYIEIISISKQEKHSIIEIRVINESVFFHIPFTDDASIDNVMHCITCLKFMEWSNEEIQSEIQQLDEIPMRLEIKKGINECFVIDDTYNNDLAGLDMALGFQANQKLKTRKTLILSDIQQSGMQSKELYTQVGELLERYNLNKVIAIGKDIGLLHESYKENIVWYKSTRAFLDSFKNEIILLKGARSFRFESIVKVFQEKIHGTVLEINLDNVSHNLNVFRRMLPGKTRIMIMVKALAYGSGSLEIANLMQYHRVDYLGVAYADEGIFLRTNGINTPIMVMNPSKESFENLVRFRLEPEIYSFQILNDLIAYLRENNHRIGIHLKFDTGMHRLGFDLDNLDKLIEILGNSPELEILSIFSHLAGADSAKHDIYTHHQAELFYNATQKLCDTLDINPIKHLCNSAGVVRFPQYHMDMVRLGIGLYGFDIGLKELRLLKPISTLKTEVSQIKYLDSGQTVGYDRAGLAEKKSKIAIISIGYADGFSRAFSNGKAEVWINGNMAPVIGNVCMDMTMIDVTGIDIKEGDAVIIFGNEASIGRLSDAIGTIPYEILTSVSARVKRVFYSS
ncbi:bifunctional UDP-N-acetylmuramoyl-tripeptide:D-alanyl-D-alanine ligase/alanine racemase, partial [Bacteroidota bacterium]